jgi:hypothetical protein
MPAAALLNRHPSWLADSDAEFDCSSAWGKEPLHNVV